MKQPHAILLILIFVLSISNSVLGSDADPLLRRRPLKVVCTTGMIADAAKIISAGKLEVHALMGPGVDPHLYKPKKSDIDALATADLILYHGLFLEGKMESILTKLKRSKKAVHAVTEVIPKTSLLSSERYADQYDPHVWFDVPLWSLAVRRIGALLEQYDPTNASFYHKRTQLYLKDLNDLDTWIRTTTAVLPPHRRILITAHDAFRYFGRAYGFEVHGLQGISTVSEPSARDVMALADLIVKKQVPAIFIETSIPVRNIEALRQAVRARGWDVSIGGSLYSDALGDPGSPAGHYIGMVKHNVTTIVEALTKTGIEPQEDNSATKRALEKRSP